MSILFAEPFSTRLAQQADLLRDVSRLYDEGAYAHALSIAGRASVIIEMLRSAEGGKHIRALGITFPTPIDPSGSASKQVSPLVSKQCFVNDDMTIVAQNNLPVFADPNSDSGFRVNLGKWLAQPSFYSSPQEFVSRERLISMMRNKDGGGHPYSAVPAEYLQFAQGTGALSVTVSDATGCAPKPEPQIHFASMRQIAHELLEAIS